jgi:hypothetical protein
MNVQQLPRFVGRASLVLAPLVHLVSTLVVASLASGATAEVAAIGRHPDRYYLFTLLQLIGLVLFVPLVAALMHLTRTRAPLPAVLGAGLMQLGVLVGIADAGTQLVYWQTGTRSADPAQMARLLHRFESAPGANAIFMAGGLSLMAGSIVLGFALWRARVAPVWAALCLPLGLIGTVVAFGAGSRPMLAGASVVLLAGLTVVAIRTRDRASSAPVIATVGAQ